MSQLLYIVWYPTHMDDNNYYFKLFFEMGSYGVWRTLIYLVYGTQNIEYGITEE